MLPNKTWTVSPKVFHTLEKYALSPGGRYTNLVNADGDYEVELSPQTIERIITQSSWTEYPLDLDEALRIIFNLPSRYS